MKKSSNLLKLLGAVFISLFLGHVASVHFASFGYDVSSISAGAVVFTTYLLFPKEAFVFGSGSLDISALPSKMKDYALAYQKNIYSRIINSEIPLYFLPIAGVKDEIPLMELLVDDILQPGGKDAFSPTANAVKFKSRIGKTRAGKIDLEFTNSTIVALHKSYLGAVEGGRVDPYVLPFEAYIFDAIIKRGRKNLIEAAFKGVYNAAGTSKLDVMDGLLTIVAADITAGNIPAANITAGAILTSANAKDEVDKIADKIVANTDYTGEDYLIIMGADKARMYAQDYQASVGAVPYNTEFKKTFVDGTNIEIVSEPFMNSTNRILAVPKDYLLWMYDVPNGSESIIVEKQKRNIDILLDVNVGVNYPIAEKVFVNNYASIV